MFAIYHACRNGGLCVAVSLSYVDKLWCHSQMTINATTADDLFLGDFANLLTAASNDAQMGKQRCTRTHVWGMMVHINLHQKHCLQSKAWLSGHLYPCKMHLAIFTILLSYVGKSCCNSCTTSSSTADEYYDSWWSGLKHIVFCQLASNDAHTGNTALHQYVNNHGPYDPTLTATSTVQSLTLRTFVPMQNAHSYSFNCAKLPQ